MGVCWRFHEGAMAWERGGAAKGAVRLDEVRQGRKGCSGLLGVGRGCGEDSRPGDGSGVAGGSTGVLGQAGSVAWHGT